MARRWPHGLTCTSGNSDGRKRTHTYLNERPNDQSISAEIVVFFLFAHNNNACQTMNKWFNILHRNKPINEVMDRNKVVALHAASIVNVHTYRTNAYNSYWHTNDGHEELNIQTKPNRVKCICWNIVNYISVLSVHSQKFEENKWSNYISKNLLSNSIWHINWMTYQLQWS